MYPNRDLIWLAAHKAAVRRRIALRRVQSTESAARIAVPFQWFDRMLFVWRKVPPLAAVVQRALFPKLKVLGAVSRWAPFVFAVVRNVRSSANRRRG